MDLSKLNINTILPYIIDISGKIFIAIIAFFIGIRVINWLLTMVKKSMDKRSLDPTLRPFLLSIISALLKAALFIAIAGMLGVATTSFVAILGAAGLAVGLALQGSLSNFAGGTLLILFRPFKVGDYIKSQGLEGFVKDIQVFTTTLETSNNIAHILPNGPLANGNITVVSKNDKIRLNLPVGIGYGADIKQARQVILEVVNKHSKVLKNPAADVVVGELADSSVNLIVRPWVAPADAPSVTVSLNEEIKIALDNANIEIPFPQQVVHHINN